MELEFAKLILTETAEGTAEQKAIFKGGDDDNTWTLTIVGKNAEEGYTLGFPYEVSIKALQKKLTETK